MQNPLESIGAAVGTVGAAVRGTLRRRAMRMEEEYIARRPKNRHIYIYLKRSNDKAEFKVTDLDGVVLYTASGSLSKHHVSLRVKTASGKAVGEIKKALIAVRNPLKHEENPADFIITLNDGNKITVKTIKGYDRLVVAPYNWTIGYHAGDNVVASDEEVLFYYDDWGYDKYMLDYRHKSIEKQAVLITMAIMAEDYWKSLQD